MVIEPGKAANLLDEGLESEQLEVLYICCDSCEQPFRQ